MDKTTIQEIAEIRAKLSVLEGQGSFTPEATALLMDALQIIERNFEQDRLLLKEVKSMQNAQGIDGRNRSLILLGLIGLLGLAFLSGQVSGDAFVNALIAIAGSTTLIGAIAANRSR